MLMGGRSHPALMGLVQCRDSSIAVTSRLAVAESMLDFALLCEDVE